MSQLGIDTIRADTKMYFDRHFFMKISCVISNFGKIIWGKNFFNKVGRELEYKSILLDMIKDFASGATSAQDFIDEYYNFFIEEVPDDLLSENDESFFSSIQEQMDFVDVEAEHESDRAGFQNPKEFRSWVSEKLGEYGTD